VETALADDPWRAIGELHLFAPDRRSPVFLSIVSLAAERGLPLLVHSDPAVIDSLFEHAPQARVIWAHAGAYPYPPLLADYLGRYPNLYADLSVREDQIAPGGELDPAWWRLLVGHPDRFLVGVDTYSPARWGRFGEVTAAIRGWLDQLPPDVAERIARGNAQRIFATGDGVRD
jgi:predicted TIM-barrel fold metal-dependent hydrolase